MRVLKLVAVVLSIFALASCGPRGESKSVQEVLDTARDRFAKEDIAALKPEASQNVQALVREIEGMVKATDRLVTDGNGAVSEGAARAVTNLEAVIERSGVTVRPAIAELTNQYRMLAIARDPINPGAVKLLVARTYSTLCSELETSKFSL